MIMNKKKIKIIKMNSILSSETDIESLAITDIENIDSCKL